MKTAVILSLSLSVAVSALWGRPPRVNDVPETAQPVYARAAARAARMPHPRLFADREGFEALKARAASDAYVRMGAEHVRELADGLLGAPPCRRALTGMRLLGVSREALYRINTLALAYRLYGRPEHLARAVAELRAVCAFSDWNPSHFLDVAEMSLAVATGYDWLYPDLDDATRREVAAALRRHGLEAGMRPAWWIRATSNWGQVCHAGMLAAALALAEENPDETARLVQRCVERLPLSMAALAPRGNYPEGPGYWNYGVEFNVAAVALLEGTLGDDFGLASLSGFRETADYPDLVTGPTGKTFNYSDGGSGRGTCFATWWFAARFGRPDLLVRFERDAYRRYCTERRVRKGASVPAHARNRMFAYGLFWVRTPPDGLKPGYPLAWDAGGRVPIALQRSSWDDPDAFFVGLKGGSPSFNHGHMDGGSFILEAQGVRWAVDIGAESYNKVEQAIGMKLWDMAQDSARWSVYRLGTASHNVPMLDGCPQRVKGFVAVRVERPGPASAVSLDLTSLYTNATRVVRRGEMAADGRGYALADEVEGLRAGAPIRWAMVTRAAPEVRDGDLVLRQDGKALRLSQTGALRGAWRVAPAEGTRPWDSANKGLSQVSFTVPMPEKGAARLGVAFRAE